MKILMYMIISSLLVLSCNKEEGPGGTSSMQGTIFSTNHEYARSEETEVFFTNGLEIEHGEYWILNNPVGHEQYYVYYDNPTWISEADPGLSGRMGIKVDFDYSDSNEEVAQATFDALTEAASDDFSFELNVDVIQIVNLNNGPCTDADEVSSPFEFNVIRQGRGEELGEALPAVDERVFLIYGDDEVHSETSRTGGDGQFRFSYLTEGNYTVYVMSKDTASGVGSIQMIEEVSISGKKESVEIPTIIILN